MRQFEGYMTEILSTFGMDTDTPATRETPRRFLQAMSDSTAGYEGDPKLITVFDTECRGGPDCRLSQVVEGPIQFFSLCEHHALPFYGRAYVGYIAHEQIIGLSKLTRLVRLFAKRFTVQERIGQQIADSLDAMLHPHGVAVYLDAHHLCTQMRGVRETAPLTRTTFWRGNYESDPSLRTEFCVACGLHRFEPGSR
jgi:GTP cyclohydrolase I